MIKKNIYYWSPSLVNIATNMAVINSAYSLNKYSNNYKCFIINFFNEFGRFKKEIYQKNINLVKYYNASIFNFLPRHGFFKSRISFFIMFILSFVPLLKLLKKKKPEYLIIHLMTSLPLFLLIFFKFKTKFILRISGLPKLKGFRVLLWRIALKKIYAVTCPTIATMNYISSLKIVESEKIFFLADPIIDVKKIVRLKNEKINKKYNKFFFAAGRLTKQKNFELLIDGFKKISKENQNIDLIIAGVGEHDYYLKKKVFELGLEKRIHFIGFCNNVYKYMFNSIAFISTSLWEDPGFAIVESIFCKAVVISSNCPNGPAEILINGKGGYLFDNFNLNSMIEKIQLYLHDMKNNKKKVLFKKVLALKNIKKYTFFMHFLTLKNIMKI
jgi:glycosyltransferase involved in cell wall biosynthesis